MPNVLKGKSMEQTFAIVENGKVRDMTPEEIDELTEIEEVES